MLARGLLRATAACFAAPGSLRSLRDRLAQERQAAGGAAETATAPEPPAANRRARTTLPELALPASAGPVEPVDLEQAYAARLAVAAHVAKDREQREDKKLRFLEWQAKQREKGAAQRLARTTRRAEAKKRRECGARSGRMIIIEHADPFVRARGGER